jgi:hypothetical protein
MVVMQYAARVGFFGYTPKYVKKAWRVQVVQVL